MTWGRALRIGFVVIACLSLLMNAAVIGLGLRLTKHGVVGDVGRGALSMPREIRQLYGDRLKASRPRLRSLRRDLRAKRRVMLTLASAQPLDKPALEAAMKDMREATQRLQEAIHRAMLTPLGDGD